MSAQRKLNYNNNSNEILTDGGLLHAINYIREFSLQAAIYQNEKSDESLVLLNRNLSLLSTVQPKHFAPKNLEVSKFYIDLHILMGALDVESESMWTCINLLQHCSRNIEARHVIVEEYRFVSLLSFVLKRIQRHDRIPKLLLLLQDLTYGIHITWEEPYLHVLLEKLVNIVYNNTDEQEQSLGHLALSVLINLCYNNFVVLFLFLRSVNISSFSKRIKKFGMLANKMLIILSEDIHTFEQRELFTFLRSAFASIDDCFKHWNVPHFRHIVEFLLDSKRHSGLHQAMLKYEHYCEDIERLLDQLEVRGNMDDSNEENLKYRQICLGLLMQLIRYVIELSGIQDGSGHCENIISLDSNLLRIFELTCNWIESDVCGIDAIELLNTMIRITKKDTIPVRIARDPTIIAQLISISEKPECKAEHISAILRLLLTLLQQTKTEKLILSRITESYFDNILNPLLILRTELHRNNAISRSEVEKSVFCLLLLINFAGIAKKAYFDKCCALLETEQIQYALARGMLSGSEYVCSAIFEIAKFEHFPETAVAKHFADISARRENISDAAETYNVDVQWKNLNALLKNQRIFVDKEIEQRLNALIDVISKEQRNKQLQNVPTSQIIELYNYRIEIFNCAERSMQQRLENASEQITQLTQRLNLQNAELEKYRAANFELFINQERLQTQCKDLNQQKDELKCTMTDLLKQLSAQTETLKINEKHLAMKSSEIADLHKNCKDLKGQLDKKTEELLKIEISSKENSMRIEKLKKTVNAYEHDIKDKVRSLEEKERDLSKAHKALDEQKEARKKAEEIVGVLEVQLQEKKEQIISLELEQKETEEMRKTILSLMEAKKPKRKT